MFRRNLQHTQMHKHHSGDFRTGNANKKGPFPFPSRKPSATVKGSRDGKGNSGKTAQRKNLAALLAEKPLAEIGPLAENFALEKGGQGGFLLVDQLTSGIGKL